MLIIVGLLSILALISILIGVLLALQEPSRLANRLAARFSWSIAAWLILNALDPFLHDAGVSLILGHLTFFTGILVAVTWLELASLPSLTSRQAPRWQPPAAVAALAAGAAITLTPGVLIDQIFLHRLPYGFHEYATDAGELVFLVYFVGLMMTGFVLIERKMHQAKGIERLQYQYLYFSVLPAFIGGTLFSVVLPRIAGIDMPWVGPALSIFWVVGTGYAITKHQLLNVEVVASELFLGLLLILSLMTVLGSRDPAQLAFHLVIFALLFVIGVKLIRISMTATTTRDVMRQRQLVLGYIRRVRARALAARGERAVLEAFRRMALRVPAYQQILREHGVDHRDIKSIEEFQRHVPIVDKFSTFARFSLPEMCLDGNLDGIVSVLMSSGHSGVFSFSVNTTKNLQTSARSVDLGLQYAFGIDLRRSILINALPMGVRVRTERAVLSETSVREDMVWATARYLSPHYDQTILVGEGSFIKKIVEEGPAHGVDWTKTVVHVAVGEEGIAEGWRRYLQHLLRHDPERPECGTVISSMGVAELDMNIFHETRDTIAIRRLAYRDAALRVALFGDETKAMPMFFQYYPDRTFVETVLTEQGSPGLVVSMLSPELKIPLVRYNTKDHARVYSYDEVAGILKKSGYRAPPELRLPFVAVSGRGQGIRLGRWFVTPEEIKEGIYADFAVASATTGNFKIALSEDRSAVEIHIQAKTGVAPTADLAEALERGIAQFTAAPVKALWYRTESFPWSMTVDYERKFDYLLARDGPTVSSIPSKTP